MNLESLMQAMYRPFALSTLLGIVCVCVCGCTSSKELLLEPVGPHPQALTRSVESGYLMVFSAMAQDLDSNSLPYRDRYSPFSVTSAEGKVVLAHVHNDSGAILGSPEKLELPVGNYHVVARANGYGRVIVPVTIKPQQTTVVHLEGEFSWSHGSGIRRSNPVRLPSGEIVGWRAQQ